MDKFFDWLTKTPGGVATMIVGLIAVFVLVAAFLEHRTKKLYPDRSRKRNKG